MINLKIIIMQYRPKVVNKKLIDTTKREMRKTKKKEKSRLKRQKETIDIVTETETTTTTIAVVIIKKTKTRSITNTKKMKRSQGKDIIVVDQDQEIHTMRITARDHQNTLKSTTISTYLHQPNMLQLPKTTMTKSQENLNESERQL